MLYSINFVKGQNNIPLGILLQDNYKRFFLYTLDWSMQSIIMSMSF